VGVGCHQSWCFVRRYFQLYDTSPMILNWPWAWPCWNYTTSYKFSVSVKKMGEGRTGGASDIIKAKSSGEDPRATGGLVSNLPQPRDNKTKQHSRVNKTKQHYQWGPLNALLTKYLKCDARASSCCQKRWWRSPFAWRGALFLTKGETLVGDFLVSAVN